MPTARVSSEREQKKSTTPHSEIITHGKDREGVNEREKIKKTNRVEGDFVDGTMLPKSTHRAHTKKEKY